LAPVSLTKKKCLHCNKRVPNLENHIKREACFTVGVYCKNCCIIFLKTKQYHNHLGSCKNIAGGALKCQFCSFKFQDRYALVNHLYTDHLDKLPVPHKKCKHKVWCLGLKNHHSKKCIFCDCQLSTKSDLMLHLYSKHVNEIAPKREDYECSLCLEKFCSISLLYIHHKNGNCIIKSHKICPICMYPVANNVDLLVHVQMIHNQKSIDKRQAFFCISCVQIFNSQEQLDVHYQKNHIYMCDVCGLICQKKSILDMHRRSTKFCKICRLCPGVFFPDKTSVKSHMRKHNWCEICKNFYAQEEMPQHLKKTHSLRCDFCTNANFKNEKELEKHRSEFHIFCDKSQCSKWFAGIDDWLIHKIKSSIKTVSNSSCEIPKTVNCLHCFQPFANVSDLERHVLEMTCFYSINVCRFCLRSFFSKPEFNKHVQNSRCAQNECELCEVKFSSSAQFTYHRITFSL